MFNTLNMETTILFKCNICNKKYCREKSYQRHKLFCEILNDDKGHQKNLGIYNLALIVEELVKSNTKGCFRIKNLGSNKKTKIHYN